MEIRVNVVSLYLTLIVRVPSIHGEVVIARDGSHSRTWDGRMSVCCYVSHRRV